MVERAGRKPGANRRRPAGDWWAVPPEDRLPASPRPRVL